MDSEEDSIELGEVVSDEEISNEEISGDQIDVYLLTRNCNYDKLEEKLKNSNISLDFHYQGSTPLTLAAEFGYYEICDLLLKHKPKPNVKLADKHDNDTPLHCAIYGGRRNMNVIRLLVENGADKSIDQVNKDGQTPLQMANEGGLTEIAEFLVAHCSNIAFKDLNNLDPGILKHHFEKVGIKHKAMEKKLILDFSVFKNAPNKDKKQVEEYVLIKRLVIDDKVRHLCSHPYITAFLDVQYSALKHISNQMLDTMSNLCLMMLLWGYKETFGNSGDESHITVVGVAMFLAIFLFDLLAFVGLRTPLINKWLKKSLVQNKKLIKQISEEDGKCCKWLGRSLVSAYDILLHLLGYILLVCVIALGFAGTYHKHKDSVRWWLRLAMIVFSALMVIKELTQIYRKVESSSGAEEKKNEGEDKEKKHIPEEKKKKEEENPWAKALKFYLRNTTNYMDWFIIITVFAFAYQLEVHKGDNYQKVPYMENLMQIVILICWFRLFTDLIECLPISGYKQNLDMFYFLIKVYLKILLCFAPFFIAFSVIFKVMAQKEGEPFSNGWLDALVKTFVMFIGELEFGDLTYGENKFGANWSIGKLLALAFAFLFAVVVMNLLNAVAIGDIQKLRDDAQIIQNQYKLLMLLEQKPYPIYARCEFEIGDEPKEQARGLLGLISKKGYFGNGYVNPKEESEEGKKNPFGDKPRKGRSKTTTSVTGNPKEKEKGDAKLFLEAPTMRLCKEATKDDGLEAKLKGLRSKLEEHLRKKKEMK